MSNEKWFLIDGNSLIYRTFYALPPLTTSKGVHTGAIRGFTTILLKIINEEKPDYIGVAFDKRTPTIRHEYYEEYKAGRLKMPEDLAVQIPLLKAILEAFGIKIISLDGYEADDLIGTLSKYGEEKGIEVKIITGDRDAYQLASDLTTIWYTKKGISEFDAVDQQEIYKKYGITPQELIDVKGLMGDKSDNIPGVPGIGEKTALKLIQEYKSIEGVYENIDKIKGKVLYNNLLAYKEQAVLSKRLATIVRNIPLELDINEFKYKGQYNKKVIELFNELEFNAILDGMGIETQIEEEQLQLDFENISNERELKTLLGNINKSYKIFLNWYLEGENHRKKTIQAIAIGLEKKFYYIDLDSIDKEYILQELRPVLENKDIKKICHNGKEIMVFLLANDIKLRGLEFDTYIAAYILDPSESRYDLHLLSSKYLHKNIGSKEQLLGKGKNAKLFSDLNYKDKSQLLISELATLIELYEEFKVKIQEQNMNSLYYEIELPLIYVLADMEDIGFRVEKNELMKLSKEFGEKIEKLTLEIYELAGEEFNINSPKQLGHILFDVLKLPVIKRTKTGYSTNIEVLEKLKDKHPIIEKIMDIRQLVKLKSTYVDGLMDIIDNETLNIHSSFNQTITSTGRISSSEPNLQNIPVRMEMGRRIRRVFVPRNPDNYLVDADYSQIELRVLAHISGDENLINAFNKDQDIHTQTASQVFDVAIEDVTPAMRNSAKAVNFGIVYGISDFGLSRDLNIPRYEAKQYIDNYKMKYFGVNKYMEDIKKEAAKLGYVTTIFGRKRYIEEIRSRNFNLRALGERLALNTPIQGTAADIIKIAMINVHKRLEENNMESKLILQVHDELIVEATEKELEEVKIILAEEMTRAASLKVELKVDITHGKSWYETK
ncbi:MAG TPA: DNA polymerase I [Eubacteriaceae bacterium]|nr:DNA polymerase I [Eubacteriaceae bacterium]